MPALRVDDVMTSEVATLTEHDFVRLAAESS